MKTEIALLACVLSQVFAMDIVRPRMDGFRIGHNENPVESTTSNEHDNFLDPILTNESTDL